MTENIETAQAAKKLHTVEGRVVSNRMDKTVTVLVEPTDMPTAATHRVADMRACAALLQEKL